MHARAESECCVSAYQYTTSQRSCVPYPSCERSVACQAASPAPNPSPCSPYRVTFSDSKHALQLGGTLLVRGMHTTRAMISHIHQASREAEEWFFRGVMPPSAGPTDADRSCDFPLKCQNIANMRTTYSPQMPGHARQTGQATKFRGRANEQTSRRIPEQLGLAAPTLTGRGASAPTHIILNVRRRVISTPPGRRRPTRPPARK